MRVYSWKFIGEILCQGIYLKHVSLETESLRTAILKEVLFELSTERAEGKGLRRRKLLTSRRGGTEAKCELQKLWASSP